MKGILVLFIGSYWVAEILICPLLVILILINKVISVRLFQHEVTLSVPMAYGSSQARDQTLDTAMTGATAATTPDP